MNLDAWVVFDRPSDFPDDVVVRRFLCDRGPEPVPTGEVVKVASLEDARRFILTTNGGPNRICFPRQAEDPPTVVETWL